MRSKYKIPQNTPTLCHILTNCPTLITPHHSPIFGTTLYFQPVLLSLLFLTFSHPLFVSQSFPDSHCDPHSSATTPPPQVPLPSVSPTLSLTLTPLLSPLFNIHRSLEHVLVAPSPWSPF